MSEDVVLKTIYTCPNCNNSYEFNESDSFVFSCECGEDLLIEPSEQETLMVKAELKRIQYECPCGAPMAIINGGFGEFKFLIFFCHECERFVFLEKP